MKVNEEEDTVEYYTRRLYAFNQGESGCRSDEDEITILNPSVMVSTIISCNQPFCFINFLIEIQDEKNFRGKLDCNSVNRTRGSRSGHLAIMYFFLKPLKQLESL